MFPSALGSSRAPDTGSAGSGLAFWSSHSRWGSGRTTKLVRAPKLASQGEGFLNLWALGGVCGGVGGQLGPEAGLPMATWGLTGCPGQRSASSSSRGSRRRPLPFGSSQLQAGRWRAGPWPSPQAQMAVLGTRWDVAAAATGSLLPAKAEGPWRGEHGSSHGALPCSRPHTQSPGRAHAVGASPGHCLSEAGISSPGQPRPAACCPRAEELCLSRSPDTEEPPSGLSMASRISRGQEE